MRGAPRRRLLWAGFAVAHVWLAALGVVVLPDSTHDVELYRRWAADAVAHGVWPVLDIPWVYPAGALLPVMAAAPFAASAVGYAIAWFALVAALDATALHVLLRTAPHGEGAAWWWVAALVALGPVALGRLEGVVAPLAVLGLVIAARRPGVASALFTLAAWIKVAPGALVVALLATARRPLHTVAVPAALVSAVVAGLALGGGAGARLLGFLTTQGTRDLQVESVAATPFSLARLVGAPVWAELDHELNTYEIAGPGTGGLTRLLDVLLVALVLAIGGLAWRAARRTAGAPATRTMPVDVLLLAAFALELALVVANKVGSPQFVAWLLPPVTVALAHGGWTPPWRRRALLVLVVAGLTQWVFPLDYWSFLLGQGPVVAAAAARNVLLVVLLVGATADLARQGGGSRPAASVTR